MQMRRIGIGQRGQRGQLLGQFQARRERPAQAQGRPSTVQHAGGGAGVGVERRAATSGHQVVQVCTRMFSGTLRPQRSKPFAVPRQRRGQGGRAAAGVAAFGLQMLGGIGLHAHQQIKALGAQRPHEALVDERLHHVHGPRRVGQGGKVDHGFGGFEREAALEHRDLRQRGFVGRGQQVPAPVESGPQRGLAVVAAAAAGQELEALAHAGQQGARRQGAHARGSQLNGQRQAVEQFHQRGYGRFVFGAGFEVAPRRGSAAHEQGLRIGRLQRSHGQRLFACDA